MAMLQAVNLTDTGSSPVPAANIIIGKLMPTESKDVLTVTEGQNVFGLGGPDEFTWTGGNATIHGGDTGENYDTNVYGTRDGGDRLFINQASKVILTSTEDGTATNNSGTLSFEGIERIHLSDGDDIVRAGQATVDRYGLSIYANGGNDLVIGSSGEDFIDGGDGNDTIYAGGGDDFIQSSRGNDVIYGGAGQDNIRWGQGNFEEVVGNDTIYGGEGHDLMNVWIKDGYVENGKGVAVNVVKVNAAGDFRLTAETDIGGAKSTLDARNIEQGWTHEGKDTVSGANANVLGEAGFHWNTRWGDDILVGSRGNDTLEGGTGQDTITGGAGDDLISGANDYYNMNAPADGDVDTFIFRAGHGNDTIIAFDADVDILDLGGVDYEITENGQGTLLTNGQDSILLYGVHDFDL